MQEKYKSVKKNMIMNAILAMSTLVFPLVTFPYISRVLLPVGTGKVSFAVATIKYFAMFAQLGIPTYGIRACSKVRDNIVELSRTVHELLFINIVTTFIVYVVLLASIMSIDKFHENKALLFLVSSSLLLNTIGVEWFYRAMEKYTYITICSVICKFISLICMFLFVHSKNDYLIYGGFTVIASYASGIFNFINLRKYITLKPLKSYNIKRHIKLVLVFFSMSIAATVYTNLDTVMLGFMKSDSEVGYYSAAVKVKGVLVSVVTSASTVLLPRMTSFMENGKQNDFNRLSKKTMNLIFLVSIPLCIFFIIFAKKSILFLSGYAYLNSVVPMQIIMPTLLIIGITNILGIQIMVPLGREVNVLYSEIAGAITDLILNFIFIPKLGAAGAAIGTLAAETVVMIFQIYYIKDIAIKLLTSIQCWKILIAVIISSALCIWAIFINSIFISLLIASIIFFSVYAIVLVLLKESLASELINSNLAKIKNKLNK